MEPNPLSNFINILIAQIFGFTHNPTCIKYVYWNSRMNIILISCFFAATLLLTLFFAIKTVRQYGHSALDNINAYGSKTAVKTIKISQRAQQRIIARPLPKAAKSDAIIYLNRQTVTDINAVQKPGFHESLAESLSHAA